ncbi:MAG: choice-of-anchor tandem repeat GloVer-containing protein [Candidatus Korobacteraceae bacterium]
MSAASPTPSAKSAFLKIASLLLIYCVATAMAASAQNLTTLVSFDVTNGQGPYFESLVQGTDGNLYGTTYQGGANSFGTVFKVNPSTGTLTTLHSFAGGTTDGSFPGAGLVLASDGNFYGTTTQGGSNTYGTVFKITPAGTLTLLHSFTVVDGRGPWSGLVQGTDGNLYGTTTFGGSNQIGKPTGRYPMPA